MLHQLDSFDNTCNDNTLVSLDVCICNNLVHISSIYYSCYMLYLSLYVLMYKFTNKQINPTTSLTITTTFKHISHHNHLRTTHMATSHPIIQLPFNAESSPSTMNSCLTYLEVVLSHLWEIQHLTLLWSRLQLTRFQIIDYSQHSILTQFYADSTIPKLYDGSLYPVCTLNIVLGFIHKTCPHVAWRGGG